MLIYNKTHIVTWGKKKQVLKWLLGPIHEFLHVGKEYLIVGQDLHTASLSAQKTECGRNKRNEEIPVIKSVSKQIWFLQSRQT